MDMERAIILLSENNPLTDSSRRIPSPWPIQHNPQFAFLLGCIIADWNRVEYDFVMLLAASFGTDSGAIMRLVYAIKSPQARLDAIGAAFEFSLLAHPEKEEAIQLVEKAGRLLELRNRYAHYLYVESMGGILNAVSFRNMGTEKALNRELHINEMEDLLSRIREVARSVSRIGQIVHERKRPPGFG